MLCKTEVGGRGFREDRDKEDIGSGRGKGAIKYLHHFMIPFKISEHFQRSEKMDIEILAYNSIESL